MAPAEGSQLTSLHGVETPAPPGPCGRSPPALPGTNTRIPVSDGAGGACHAGGNTRTTTYHPTYPPVFRAGRGAILPDLDGHDYIDLFQNGLSLIHGHAHPTLVWEGLGVLERGTAWSGASDTQIAFAELLAARIGGCWQVRFAKTGSEAGMLAVKLARVETDRALVLKFRYAYYGSYPDLEAGLHGEGEQPGRRDPR